MTASPARRRPAAAGALLSLLSLGIAVPAAAQPMIFSRQGVEIDHLTAVDPESVGVNDQPPASLGIDLWQGSDRTQIVGLVRDLPRRIESPSLHALTRRLLLTTAKAPVSGISSVQTLTAARVTTLASIGATADAATLLEAAGARSRGEAIARIELDMLLLNGQIDKACEAAAAGAGRYEAADWQYSVAFCRALQKDETGARLAVDLVRDSGAAEYLPLNGILVEAVLGTKPPPLKFATMPTALQLAMLNAAQLPIPREALSPERPDVQGAIARMENAPPGLRLEAAEMAVSNNALDGATLVDLYGKLDVPANGSAAAGRAAAWRKLTALTDPAAKAKALKDFLETARKRGNPGWRAAAAASLPVFDTLRPDPAHATLAEEATRALLMAGRVPDARGWYALAAESGKPEGNAQRVRLWPLVRLADASGALGFNGASLDMWAAAAKTANPKAAPAQTALLYSLLAAVGDPVPETALSTLAKPATPSEKLTNAVIRIGTPGISRGEAILLAIIILGEAEDGTIDGAAVQAAITALSDRGLDTEARAIGVELAINAGI